MRIRTVRESLETGELGEVVNNMISVTVSAGGRGVSLDASWRSVARNQSTSYSTVSQPRVGYTSPWNSFIGMPARRDAEKRGRGGQQEISRNF